jgi:hypothetical protein
MLSAFLWGGLAAASLLIDFALAGRGLSNRAIGLVMGVGAGALISAIAYELVPDEAVMGLRTAASWWACSRCLALLQPQCYHSWRSLRSGAARAGQVPQAPVEGRLPRIRLSI